MVIRILAALLKGIVVLRKRLNLELLKEKMVKRDLRVNKSKKKRMRILLKNLRNKISNSDSINEQIFKY